MSEERINVKKGTRLAGELMNPSNIANCIQRQKAMFLVDKSVLPQEPVRDFGSYISVPKHYADAVRELIAKKDLCESGYLPEQRYDGLTQ
jgi:hypothetical protein